VQNERTFWQSDHLFFLDCKYDRNMRNKYQNRLVLHRGWSRKNKFQIASGSIIWQNLWGDIIPLWPVISASKGSWQGSVFIWHHEPGHKGGKTRRLFLCPEFRIFRTWYLHWWNNKVWLGISASHNQFHITANLFIYQFVAGESFHEKVSTVSTHPANWNELVFFLHFFPWVYPYHFVGALSVLVLWMFDVRHKRCIYHSWK